MTQRYHRALRPVFHIAVLGIVLVDAFMSIQKQTKGGRPREEIGRRRRPPFLPLLCCLIHLFKDVWYYSIMYKHGHSAVRRSAVRVDGRVHVSDAVD